MQFNEGCVAWGRGSDYLQKDSPGLEAEFPTDSRSGERVGSMGL